MTTTPSTQSDTMPVDVTSQEPVGASVEIPSPTQDGGETDDIHEESCDCKKCNCVQEEKKKVTNWIKKAVDKKKKNNRI